MINMINKKKEEEKQSNTLTKSTRIKNKLQE